MVSGLSDLGPSSAVSGMLFPNKGDNDAQIWENIDTADLSDQLIKDGNISQLSASYQCDSAKDSHFNMIKT